MASEAVRADYVPKDAYLSPDFALREREALWPRTWQVACRTEELKNVGSYVTYEICGQSVIVVRDTPETLRAYHNVCLHRGRRLVKGCGTTKLFRCNFHGWRWKIDGTLDTIVDEKDWAGCPDMDHASFRLPELRVDTWGGFVFVNFEEAGETLAEFLAPMPQYIDPFEFEKMSIRWHYSVKVPCNWKVALEAFSEGYHVSTTHPQLLSTYGDDYSYSRAMGKHGMFYYDRSQLPPGAPSPRLNRPFPEDLRPGIVSAIEQLDRTLKAIVTPRDAVAARRLLAETSATDPIPEIFQKLGQFQYEAAVAAGASFPAITAEQMQAAGVDWHVFPNLVFLPGLSGAIAYRSRPWGDGGDPDWCVFDIWSLEKYAPGGEPPYQPVILHDDEGWRGIGDVSLILKQDFDNMAEVQRGMKQSTFKAARTNPAQEAAISNMHRVLRDYLFGAHAADGDGAAQAAIGA